jgi:hypothetical protein
VASPVHLQREQAHKGERGGGQFWRAGGFHHWVFLLEKSS